MWQRKERSTTEVELQLCFGLLILDHIHHLKTGVFRFPFFGECFKDHRTAGLPIVIVFDQFLGSRVKFRGFG